MQKFTEELKELRQKVLEMCEEKGEMAAVPCLGSLRDLRCIEEEVGDVQLQVKQGNQEFKVSFLEVELYW